ncbi:MAG: hypothetical protein NZ656_06815 [Nitrospinaceae bacterium]|nr:hypothetical protein [Nitrospinaceae bacterium]
MRAFQQTSKQPETETETVTDRVDGIARQNWAIGAIPSTYWRKYRPPCIAGRHLDDKIGPLAQIPSTLYHIPPNVIEEDNLQLGPGELVILLGAAGGRELALGGPEDGGEGREGGGEDEEGAGEGKEL